LCHVLMESTKGHTRHASSLMVPTTIEEIFKSGGAICACDFHTHKCRHEHRVHSRGKRRLSKLQWHCGCLQLYCQSSRTTTFELLEWLEEPQMQGTYVFIGEF